MANLYQCKCGAPLEVSADGRTGTCAFCGATVVFPKAGFERMNKANELRQRREFDQAEGIYRSLTIAFPDEPELWWSIVLCEYGIEYVKEIKDGKEVTIPTINRMKYESIFEQDAYKKAIALADAETQEVYEAEAKKIDDIQIQLQQIVAKEEKYDVFISFKDKDDETGERTLDSALAQDIYDALTKEGYKVFFSRITLRRMVGQEFEPKIFAALHSAPMMIVVACEKKHVEATWVKNEWSRYLKLMEKDADKYILPVYAEMKAEDLPKKLAPMEGIEANGANFMKLILKNVGERIGYKKEQRVDEKIVHDVAILEKDEVRRITDRGFNAIKAGRLEQADTYFEEALDLDVTHAKAWWGKLAVATDDFTTTDNFLEKGEPKRYYDTAMQYASEEDKKYFATDMDRHKVVLRRHEGKVYLQEFLDMSKNWNTVFGCGMDEPSEKLQKVMDLQEKILDRIDGEEGEELRRKFEEYNHRRDRVDLLKREYEAVEDENERVHQAHAKHYDEWLGYTKTIAEAKNENKITLWVIALAIVLPNTIALTFTPDSENLWILYLLSAFLGFKLWKKIKARNDHCGGSMSGMKKRADQALKEASDSLEACIERANQLPTIYNDLVKRYSDVYGGNYHYIIPMDLKGHIAEWNKKLTPAKRR